MQFKRNQVEEAIAWLEEGRAAPSSRLRTRIRHLLETDRADATKPSYNEPDRAFFSGPRPGRGVEVAFSAFEAFALLTGLRLSSLGWTQLMVVGVMREIRLRLEREHRRILKEDPLEHLHAWTALLSNGVSSGRPPDKPVLLVVKAQAGWSDVDERLPIVTVVRGRVPAPTRPTTFFELGTSIFALSDALEHTAPRPRGRRPSRGAPT